MLTLIVEVIVTKMQIKLPCLSHVSYFKTHNL